MNVKRNKKVHIIDSFNATYIHSTFNEVIDQLSKCGFGNFRRIIGGTDTDFDHDRIVRDPYGKEKFVLGDIRIVCHLIQK